MPERFGGNGFYFSLSGFNRLLRAFDDYEARARAIKGRTWLVGTVVEYARHVEFGTRRTPARHLLQRALDQVAAEISNDSGLRARLAKGLFVEDEDMIAVVAKRLRDAVEEMTVTSGAVDTGQLRDSWTAQPE